MKQLIKEPCFWFVLCLVMLLFFSIIFSHNYNENWTAKITFVDQTHNSSKPRLAFNIRIKPVEQVAAYSEQSNASPDWSNISVEGFQECFRSIKPAKVLNNYKLYPLAKFRAFLKTVCGYKEHILTKRKELFKRSRFTHFWAKLWSKMRGTTSSSHMQNVIQKMHDELVQEEEQINQLCRLYSEYQDFQPSCIKHSQLVSQRMDALQQSLNKDLQHSLVKSNWSDVDPIFIDTFNLADSTFDLNGTPVQHALQKELHDIAQGTVQAWIRHKNNGYIQQLVEKNVACIKNGIAHNQSGNVIEATHLANIGWAILDHVQALGEGMLQGADNVAQVFLHPIDTVQGTAKGIAQCTYYLGQATLEAIDLSILAVIDQNAACNKLQIWKQNFIKLTNTINEQWQVTSNRDITKFISRFTTEILVAHQAFRALHELFSVVRTNTAKLVQKVQKVEKSVPQATVSKGNVVVKEVAEHKQSVSKQTRKITKKIADKISNQKLIRTFDIAKYDLSIGDLNKLEMAVKKLKDVKGALGTNGPLRNALRFGKISCETGELGTARGAMYELEKALELIDHNEFPLEFGKIFKSTSREFDIITSKRLIECKNIDWIQISGKRLEEMKNTFGDQKKIAKGLDKIFEVHSKTPISGDWKQWFRKKGIQFVED